MKARNERTSARVARIAGRILKNLADTPGTFTVWYENFNGELFRVSASDLKALSASALTQTKDRKATTEGKRKAR